MTTRPITLARCTLRIHLTGDRRTGRLLGGQILGNRRAEISKRIDIIATAIFQGASVDYLNDLDLSYTPPFSSPSGSGPDGGPGLVLETPPARGFDLVATSDRQLNS